MKFLFDLFPVILFFIAFKFSGIYVATGVAIAATFAQIAWVWLRHRKVDAMLWISLVIICVFGGMTLLLHDETFIKCKPTVLYWSFAGALAGSQLFFGKNLIRSLLEPQMALPDKVWQQLNWSWTGFFVFMGVANLAVAFAFGLSTDLWVDFKLFGGIGLIFAFALVQAGLLAKHLKEESK